MIRARRLAPVVILLTSVAGLAVAQPASAAPAITVTPSSGLVHGQLVTVGGSGYPPSALVGLCQAVDRPPFFDTDCDFDTTQFVRASESGTFSLQMNVARRINPETGGTVDCGVDQCLIAAGNTSEPPQNSALAPISFAPLDQEPQPDARVKNRQTGEILFNDVYDGGRLSHSISPGQHWTFAVQVQNDGPTVNAFTMRASTWVESSELEVRVFSGYFDITSKVFGQGATISNIDPDQVRTFAVQFRATANAPPRAAERINVVFASRDGFFTDSLDLGVRVP